MIYRELGTTGLRVPVISFGAGPVSGWMKLPDREQQRVIAAALAHGIHWFDTAATYGDGLSESSLGAALAAVGGEGSFQLAGKVRLYPDQLDDIPGHIGRSVEASLRRLRRDSLTLLQLHNAVTVRRGDEPTSLCVGDVLGVGGVLETLDRLRQAGKVEHLGLTGLGHPESLRQVLAAGVCGTVQIPFNLLNPSAGYAMPAGFSEKDYGQLLNECGARGIGAFAIRIFAAGALAGRPPSEHTLRTPFFPLDLYRRDQRRAAEACQWLASPDELPAVALHFALQHPAVSSALIGFSSASEIELAARWVDDSSVPEPLRRWALAGATVSGAIDDSLDGTRK